MNRQTVDATASKWGIDYSDVRVEFQKHRIDNFGSTGPDQTVRLQRPAFRNEEQLAKTLYHERLHVDDLRNGAPYPETYDAGSKWERNAERRTDEWWDNHPINNPGE
jgi:hypothetical protein